MNEKIIKNENSNSQDSKFIQEVTITENQQYINFIYFTA